MSLAPIYRGQIKPVFSFKYVMVFACDKEGEQGTVEAFFTSKTIADKCCNELNATIGQGKTMWAVRKIFPDEPY